MTLKIGDPYWVNLEPTIGDEIRKKRPVIILNAGHFHHRMGEWVKTKEKKVNG